MRILEVKNLIAKILVFNLLIYFYAEAASIRSEVEDADDDSEALAAELARTLQDQTGLVKKVQYFDSLKKDIQSDASQKNKVLESAGESRHQQIHQELSKGKDDFVVSDAVASTIANIPQNPFRTSTDCGGILELARGVPSTIRFSNEGNNASCAWKIQPEVYLASYRVKVQPLGLNLNGSEELVVYFGNSTAEMQFLEITEFGSWISIPAPYAVISFHSNSGNASSGFEASIFGFGTSEDTANLKPLWLGNSTETFDFWTLDKFLDRISNKPVLMMLTSCGGALEVAGGVPSTIRYPHSGNYSNYVYCSWTIRPKVKFSSYRIKVHSYGMEDGYDYVMINSQKITNFDSWIFVPTPHVQITFRSDSTVVGQGFIAYVLGFGTSA